MPAPSRGKIQLPLCNMVLVTNISPAMSETDIWGLFSYCGNKAVAEIDMSSDMDGVTQRALVEFNSVAAAHTGLILTGAPLGDREIKVEAVEPRDPEALQPPPVNAELKAVIVERIMSAGYALGGAILQRAREYDERMMASDEEQVLPVVASDSAYGETWNPSKTKNPVVEEQLERDEELRRRYKVNEPRSTVKDIAMAKAISLDEKFKILEPATMADDQEVQKCKMIDERYKVLEKTVAPAEKGVSMAKAGYHSLKDENTPY